MLIEVDYEELPVVNDLEQALVPGAPLVHSDWASYGDTDGMVRDGNDASHSTIVKGDVDAGHARRRRRRQEPLRGRRLATLRRSSRARSWPSGRATSVTIWSSTQVPFAARSGVMRHAPAARQQGAHHRAACWAAASAASAASTTRRTSRSSRARPPAPRAPAVLAARGVPRPGQAPRGHDHRDRERREEGRHDHRPPRLPDHRQRRVHGRLGVLLRARRDARARPVQDRRARSSTPTACTRTTSRPARCAPPRRRRPAGRSSRTPTSSRTRSAWIRSSSASCNAVDTGDEGPTRQTYGAIGVQQCIANAAEMQRLRAGAARRRGDRRRHRLVAQRSECRRARTSSSTPTARARSSPARRSAAPARS